MDFISSEQKKLADEQENFDNEMRAAIKGITDHFKELEKGEINPQEFLIKQKEFIVKMFEMFAEKEQRQLEIRKKMLEDYTAIYKERLSISQDYCTLYNVALEFIKLRGLLGELDKYILAKTDGQAAVVN